MTYHAIDRKNARNNIFYKPNDCEIILQVLGEGLENYQVELLLFILMTNHWHLEPGDTHKVCFSRFH